MNLRARHHQHSISLRIRSTRDGACFPVTASVAYPMVDAKGIHRGLNRKEMTHQFMGFSSSSLEFECRHARMVRRQIYSGQEGWDIYGVWISDSAN
jgi:hypothetical protein